MGDVGVLVVAVRGRGTSAADQRRDKTEASDQGEEGDWTDVSRRTRIFKHSMRTKRPNDCDCEHSRGSFQNAICKVMDCNTELWHDGLKKTSQ